MSRSSFSASEESLRRRRVTDKARQPSCYLPHLTAWACTCCPEYLSWVSPPRRKMKSMRKLFATLLAFGLVALPFATGAADNKETERLQNCGMVLTEIMNIPDNLPQDLMDKAE